MDESRDPQPEPGTQRTPIAKLSPMQQAWSEYVEHTTRCPVCRDIDGGRCEDSEQLYRAYRKQGAQAYRGLSDGAPGPRP